MKKFAFFICTLFAVATISAQQRIALFDFKAEDEVTPIEVNGVSALFNSYFTPQGYMPLNRLTMDRITEVLGLQNDKELPISRITSLCKPLLVSKVVVGTMSKRDGNSSVEVSIIDTRTENAICTDKATWISGNQYRQEIKKLAIRLMTKLSEDRDCWHIGDIVYHNGVAGVVVALNDTTGKHGLLVTAFTANFEWLTAKKWCEQLGGGWHLPCAKEFEALHLNRDKINESLLKNGFLEKGAYGRFWICEELDSESAKYYQIGKGETGQESKHRNLCVCAFTTF